MSLEKYKELLDQYSFDAMGKTDHGQSRYASFKYCMDFLAKIDMPQVLELGTTRSFVGGAFEGCNLPEDKWWNKDDFTKWDLSAGMFTVIFGQTKCELTTLDIVDEHIRRSKVMTDSLNIKCNHIVSDSLAFLRQTANRYDLIYLDTGDMTPITPSIELQLQEAIIVNERKLVKDSGLILIDDVKNKTPREYGEINNTLGKSEKSIPYLINKGWKVVFEGYQYILSK